MTASLALTKQVQSAITGVYRVAGMDFMKNFKNTVDGADESTAGAVSTKYFADTRTLAASATENLDLAGVLTDAAGALLAFTKVHAIYVKAAAGNVNFVQVGGAGANGFAGPFANITDILNVGPGDVLSATSMVGWTVTAGTADILKITNSAGTTGVTYDILIVGE